MNEYLNLNASANQDNYFEYYTIKKGDSLYQIAKEYKTNPTLLAFLNGLNLNDYIYPDEVIMIPKTNYSYYITKEGDTLKTISDTFKIRLSELIRTNPDIYVQAGQILVNKIN